MYRQLNAEIIYATLAISSQSENALAIPATDDASIERASQEFLAKYRQSSYVGSMVRAEVLSTTLRLEPIQGTAASA